MRGYPAQAQDNSLTQFICSTEYNFKEIEELMSKLGQVIWGKCDIGEYGNWIVFDLLSSSTSSTTTKPQPKRIVRTARLMRKEPFVAVRRALTVSSRLALLVKGATNVKG